MTGSIHASLAGFGGLPAYGTRQGLREAGGPALRAWSGGAPAPRPPRAAVPPSDPTDPGPATRIPANLGLIQTQTQQEAPLARPW